MYTKEPNARKTGIRIAGVKPPVRRRHSDRDGDGDGGHMATFSPTRAIAIRSLMRVQSRRIPRPRDVAVLFVNAVVLLETL